jgi:ribonuclease-3
MSEEISIDASLSPSELETLTRHPVGDVSLYRRALTHRSVLRGQTDTHLRSNERLEFLGDALLGFIVGEVLYRTFPDEDEGFLTRLRAKLVSKRALAGYARQMDLGAHLLMTENAARGRGRENPSILSDAFEALLGAVYLDQGFTSAQAFVQKRALDTVDFQELATAEENYKSVLQERLQKDNRPLPTYTVTDVAGPSHDRTYTVEVLIDGQSHGQGVAGSKQKAEQQAARKALQRLRTSRA